MPPPNNNQVISDYILIRMTGVRTESIKVQTFDVVMRYTTKTHTGKISHVETFTISVHLEVAASVAKRALNV